MSAKQYAYSEQDRLRDWMDVDMAAFFYCYKPRQLRLMCTRRLVPGAVKPTGKAWRIPRKGMEALMQDGAITYRRGRRGRRR